MAVEYQLIHELLVYFMGVHIFVELVQTVLDLPRDLPRLVDRTRLPETLGQRELRTRCCPGGALAVLQDADCEAKAFSIPMSVRQAACPILYF